MVLKKSLSEPILTLDASKSKALSLSDFKAKHQITTPPVSKPQTPVLELDLIELKIPTPICNCKHNHEEEKKVHFKAEEVVETDSSASSSSSSSCDDSETDSNDSKPATNNIIESNQTDESDDYLGICEICYGDLSFSIRCALGHHFPICQYCFNEYFNRQVAQGYTRVWYPHQHEGVNCTIEVDMTLLEQTVAEATGHMMSTYFEYCTKYNRYTKNCPNCDHFNQGCKSKPSGMTCSKCETKYCFVHGGSHGGSPCPPEDGGDKRKREKLLQKVRRKGWEAVRTKACPSCHSRIEKNMGCNHMTCRCGHEFCWLCRRPWASHSSELFPAPRNIKYMCHAPKLWGKRIGITVAAVASVPVVVPIATVALTVRTVYQVARKL
eukprot:Colp12_sorted_trinity150504_noHs@36133